ncbi:hypothetical protein GCM10023093_14090 [Nemorincola caseinilytica]|uniref:EpsG family protein n=2 Tax=Nemorincola caseinilytica TaxID=2054315 RepID=A0ABP8NAV6_9BACT
MQRTAYVALAGLFLLAVGAVLWYQERMFADTAFIAFSITNYKRLYIQNERYGSFITQIVPLIGTKLHLSLRGILIAYSLSFNLFYFLVAGILVKGLRQYGLAILMCLYYFLFVSDSYFLINDELHQGIAWMFLMFGLLVYMSQRRVHFVLLLLPFVVLLFLAASSHFIVFVPLAYIWVYMMLQKDRPVPMRTMIALSALLVGLCLVKLNSSGSSQTYEREHLHALLKISIPDLWKAFDTTVIKLFLQRCLTNYWSAALLLLISLALLVKHGYRLIAGYLVLGVLGYCSLMGIVFANYGDSTALAHIETEWASLGIIIAAPFALTLVQHMRARTAIIMLAAIILVRSGYIVASSEKFVWRTTFMKEVFAQMRKKNITKLALSDPGDLPRKLQLHWVLPEESLFVSAAMGDMPQRSFRFIDFNNREDKQAFAAMKADSTGFSFCFTYLTPKDLNPDYYHPDTTQPYVVMPYAEFVK